MRAGSLKRSQRGTYIFYLICQMCYLKKMITNSLACLGAHFYYFSYNANIVFLLLKEVKIKDNTV
jgi:hypothetical protein